MTWVICQLHLNELPFRHFYYGVDGKPTGPSSFRGPIGGAICDAVHRLPVVNFKKFSSRVRTVPQSVLDGFTRDQKYLYEISIAVQSGFLCEKLKTRNPGTVVQSRWLTTANNILRLYVSDEKPTPELKR